MLASSRTCKRRVVTALKAPSNNRLLSSSVATRVNPIIKLTDWKLEEFQERAFVPQCPAKLPYHKPNLPRAFTKWFTHEYGSICTPNEDIVSSELKKGFWSHHESIMVPLELTTRTTNQLTATGRRDSTFHRSEAPLKVLLTHLDSYSQEQSNGDADYSIYLAQCDIRSLPKALQDDLPPPEIVQRGGKGDIYASSIWLGRPPTYTPLHRDPNPNLLLQLAGQKSVRLLPPEVGDAIFDTVQEKLDEIRIAATRTENMNGRHLHHQSSTSASFRGEEMMQGPEREILHDIIWTGSVNDQSNDGSSSKTSDVSSSQSEGSRYIDQNSCGSKSNSRVETDEFRIAGVMQQEEQEQEQQAKQEQKEERKQQQQYKLEPSQQFQMQQLLDHYAIEAHIKPGEAIFIPKGWWHSVKGTGQTGITASANWWFR